MKFAAILFFASLVFISCKNQQKADEKLFILPGDESFFGYYDSTIIHLKQKFQRGLVEHFEVNGSKFSFSKSPGEENLYDLNVIENGTSIKNLALPMLRDKGRFSVNSDYDLDGFYDLSFVEGYDVVIYFFDSLTHRFDPKRMQFRYDHVLVDSSQLIYASNTSKIEPHTWNIDVFSIAHRVKKPLMKSIINLKGNKHNGGIEIVNALIYRCENGIDTDTTLVDEIKINRQYGDFSLREFMMSLPKGIK